MNSPGSAIIPGREAFTPARAKSTRPAAHSREEVAALLALPGIGAYTANAVAAIAFNQKRLPVDGNIRRVLSRFHGLARPDAEDKAAFAQARRALGRQRPAPATWRKR